MRLINGVITEVFDPNIFYSRLSFLESGKEALDIKNNLNQGRTHNGYKLPNIKNKFYTRSALVKNLIPQPSEGKVRAKFGDSNSIHYPPLIMKRKQESTMQQTPGSLIKGKQSGLTNQMYVVENLE